MPQKKYIVFDDADDSEFPLRVASNKNIKSVCEILIGNAEFSFEERHKYAKECGIVPYKRDEDGAIVQKDGGAVIEFTNTFVDQTHYWGALAQTLFLGCPELIEFDSEGDPHIKNEDLNEKLIRSQVHQGLDDFLQSFGLKPPMRDDFFDLFQIDQNAPTDILDMVSKALTQHGAMHKKSHTKTS